MSASASDTPIELYENPDNDFVAGFIDSPRMNFLTAKAVGPKTVEVAVQRVELPNLETALQTGQSLQFGIRPEHLDAATAVHFPMVADVAEELGATTFAHG
ncbi:hypothetical protein [Pacificibacter marinus]|uniref:sn-glycerol-3-phosphate import ATP-binding protein UgpC n=1 Tax=Pacificibacter marinus TaxID=658057 RepID=A0A1Y5T9J0_9RHOB|nr:hypothetical protein [Pacificibacter marinus]SEL09148.1 multiple sugar transport system ATP-binding protein [Pacificibacter marinus]SLN58728.1 sn-glycerol-3-phosphate import ATP-binding protein UgpC [Pacificibacter marinus]